MRVHIFPPRPKGSRVAEHALDAFRARMEVVHNGINYLREEKLLCRNALATGETELYFRGYTKRPYWRKRRQEKAREASAPVDLTKTHAEKSHDEGLAAVVMWCGAIANLLDDGNIDPPEFDFYIEPWGDKATCARCLRARRKAKK